MDPITPGFSVIVTLLSCLSPSIQDLEKELIVAENKLRDAEDSIQEKGQMGFLRMAAQVDNFRKTSGAGTGDYEADAKASVLTAMLPAFEPFEAAEEVNVFEALDSPFSEQG